MAFGVFTGCVLTGLLWPSGGHDVDFDVGDHVVDLLQRHSTVPSEAFREEAADRLAKVIPMKWIHIPKPVLMFWFGGRKCLLFFLIYGV